MTVGERIRKRRLRLGLSQRDLASKGVSGAYICRIENGSRQPSTKALRLLALKLDTSVHWLETGKSDPAEALAKLVLACEGAPLPRRAAALARAVLGERGRA